MADSRWEGGSDEVAHAELAQAGMHVRVTTANADQVGGVHGGPLGSERSDSAPSMRTCERIRNPSPPTVACTLVASATDVQPPLPDAEIGDAAGPLNGRTTKKVVPSASLRIP